MSQAIERTVRFAMPERLKIVSVVGARPHFVKASPFMKAMRSSPAQVITIHTGQHYDPNMSDLFFRELGLPRPDLNLGIGSGTHAEQTAGVLLGMERELLRLHPSVVVVYGDTNSTLGAALAAAKHYVPVVHVEAGVRCSNRQMPEEINRTLIDHLSDYLVCPTSLAVKNLAGEGITRGVLNTGDLMYDTFLLGQAAAAQLDLALDRYGVESKSFSLATIHREQSTARVDTLADILDVLGDLDAPVVLPLHPRTRKLLTSAGVSLERRDGLRLVEPVGYLEMLQLLTHAKTVITDSGGVQKEAYWAGVPCVTLMNETTWPETVELGWNVLVGLDPDAIRAAVDSGLAGGDRPEVYGAPGAAQRMVEALGWI